MKIIFAQEYRKDNPFHENTLEGTVEFPVYLAGYAEEFKDLNPIRVETNSCVENKYVIHSAFRMALLGKVCSVLISSEESDAVVLRKCRFIKEELVGVKRAPKTPIDGLIRDITGADPSFNIAVFDMFFEVIY